MELSRARPLIFLALLASVICLALGPLVVPSGYSVVEHTTSEAAAQATAGAWLTRTGFYLFGLGVFSLSAAKRGWPSSARVLHGLFGLLLIAAAVYSHRPFVEGVDYDRVEDMLHSVAATGMGFAPSGCWSWDGDGFRGGRSPTRWRWWLPPPFRSQ